MVDRVFEKSHKEFDLRQGRRERPRRGHSYDSTPCPPVLGSFENVGAHCPCLLVCHGDEGS